MRSVSMNSNFGRSEPTDTKGGMVNSWGYGAPWKQWHKTSEVKKPSEMFVFIDEHPGSINDAFFVCTFGGGGANGSSEYPRTVNGAQWGDVPAFYHNRATGFGFADGHSEIKKWQSRDIPVRKSGGSYPFTQGPAHISDQNWYTRHVAER